MKEYLAITIDVEPDCLPDWRYSSPLTFKGVTEGIAKKLQPLFNKYSIAPTYLINNVVLEDDESMDVFRKLPGKYELGTHLHPEFIEPQKLYNDYAGKKGEKNCCFYPPQIEFEKIRNITALFNSQLGYAPTSFRAGRFSAGLNTIKSLKKSGYLVDTSVTPGVRWDDSTREKPVDFRNAPAQPYWMTEESMTGISASKDFLQVPVSIMQQKLSPLAFLKYAVKTKRIPHNGSRPVWLRPVFSGKAGFTDIVERTRANRGDREVLVYNMMFHNVEVMPGLSPYSTTLLDCEKYISLLDWFFNFCKSQNIQSLPLTDIYHEYRKQ